MRTKVKALEWREVTEDRGDGYRDATGDWDAVSALWTYYIAVYGASDVPRWELLLNGVPLSDHEDPESAKAAAQAHFDAAIASVLEDDWQTMETAPKDGTRIMLGRFTGNPKADREGFMAIDRYAVPTDREGSYTGFGAFNIRYWPPTHWRPLPPAPTNGD